MLSLQYCPTVAIQRVIVYVKIQRERHREAGVGGPERKKVERLFGVIVWEFCYCVW